MVYDTNKLEEYYKNPIMESWIYVSAGMDNLRNYDPKNYEKIKEKQVLLASEMDESLEYIRQTCEELQLDYSQVKHYVEQFLQKFPLALRRDVGWDDRGFIFLYILTRAIKPQVIIETGSNVGFSSSFIALAVKENNNNCKFYTIEPCTEYKWEHLSFVENNNLRKQKINYSRLSGKCEPLGVVPPDLKEYINLKSGYSKDILPGLLKENPDVDIFFHDSDHGYRNMVWECETALPHLKDGGYLLAHDIFLNSAFKEMFGGNGSLVIKEILGVYRKTGKEFAIHKEWASSLDNAQLNDKEYYAGRTSLKSSPKHIVIKLDEICGLNCIFCGGKGSSNKLGFDNFYQNLEGRISRYLSQAERITFKTCGGFFKSSEIKEMVNMNINCTELNFPEIEKIYYTNGIDLTPESIGFIVRSGGICYREYIVKNIIDILLYASNSRIYKLLTRSSDFPSVLSQVEYLIKLRKIEHNPKIFIKVFLTFIATTLNIEDLPDFIRLASNIGADKVICSYCDINVSTQKYLSCFFKQERTNEILDKVQDLAKELKMEVELPPKFGQIEYPQKGRCYRAWDQMTIDAGGNVLSCDKSKECRGNLLNEDLMDIWNSPYYQSLRKDLLDGKSECFKYCLNENPQAVNEFRSHVILGRKKEPEIDISWGDNF